jgi:TolB protein
MMFRGLYPWVHVSAVALAMVVVHAADRGPSFSIVAQGLSANEAPGGLSVSVSADGQTIAFESRAALVADDVNGVADIYLLDRRTAEIVLLSRSFDGSSANGNSYAPRVSADGRFVAFNSGATGLVPDDTNARPDVFLWDRSIRTLKRISVSQRGGQGNGWSGEASISAAGQLIAFESSATNLVEDDDPNRRQVDIYVYRRVDGRVARVATPADGRQPAVGSHFDPSLSGDGRLVAFTSDADLNCPHPQHMVRKPRRLAFTNVYVEDLVSGQVTCVSRAADGGAANGASYGASIDATGTRIAYVTDATNLGYRDLNRSRDVVVQDLRTGRVELVSRAANGAAADGPSWRPMIASKGRFIAFVSSASDLICRRRCAPGDLDQNLVPDVYLYDSNSHSMRRLSADDTGEWWASSRGPALDSEGTTVAFSSSQPTSTHDSSGDEDLFIWRADPGTGAGTHPIRK